MHFDALQEDNTRLKTFFRSYHEKPSIVSETSNARPHRNLLRYMTDFKRINHCEHMRKLRAFSFKGAVVYLCLFTVWSSSICSSTYSHSFLFVQTYCKGFVVYRLLFALVMYRLCSGVFLLLVTGKWDFPLIYQKLSLVLYCLDLLCISCSWLKQNQR